MAYFEFRTNASYVQGPGALCELKKYAFHLGSRFLIATACGPVLDEVLTKVKKSFDNSMESNINPLNRRAGLSTMLAKSYDAMNKKVEYKITDCDGWQVTVENIEKLTEAAKEFEADVIIGIGGGKVLDLVRGVYHKIGRPIQVVLCPTATATNAAGSVLTVLYNDEGDSLGVWYMPYHPALVLTDTEVTIKSPPITLAAGMGDCMGTYYEGIQAIKESNGEGSIVASAWAANEAVKNTFYTYGPQAMLSAKTGAASLAYDSVVNQIVHTGGPQSLCVAVHYPHIIDDVLIKFPQCKFMLHGLLVGYGVVPYLLWNNNPLEEIYEYIDFATEVGIPLTFEELGITKKEIDEKLMEYCEITSKGPTAMMSTAAGKLTGKILHDSIILAEAFVNDYRSKCC